jgi:hypothetical protein
MIWIHSRVRFGPALLLTLVATSVASAAVNVNNSLTGFTGNSTQASTQAAVAAASLNFFSTMGFNDNMTPTDPADDLNDTVAFDTGGASFGTFIAGDGGRNYMRTIDTDYANVNFVAEISIVTPDIDVQDAYVGLGAGDANPDFFLTPDRLTDNSSIMYWGENELTQFNPDPDLDIVSSLEVLRASNGGSFSIFKGPTPDLGNGTHRLRLSYDRFRKVAEFAFDVNYESEPFAADYTLSMDTSTLYGPDGWPTEPARIYFGGDDGTVFKDFSVNVLTTPIAKFGDLDSDNDIDAADWGIVRSNQNRNLGGLTQTAAYLLGDMNGNLTNDADDFIFFKNLFDQANGAGAFDAMLAANAPEPSAMLLVGSAGVLIGRIRRRALNA